MNQPILLLAHWLDEVKTFGGDCQQLPYLLSRFCKGAIRVHVYHEVEIIHHVTHVAKALRRWQQAGGHV